MLCSHVLEHVPDDAAAMRELRRITAPQGFCLVMVPLALDRQSTYEDPAITAPEDREREFLQFDHVRLYAPDIADRLRAAGFDVETIDMHAEVGAEQAARYRLLASRPRVSLPPVTRYAARACGLSSCSTASTFCWYSAGQRRWRSSLRIRSFATSLYACSPDPAIQQTML